MSSWLDNVADYVDTVFGRVPESMNIRDTQNPRNLPRATRKKRITNPFPSLGSGTQTNNIIRDYDAPMALPPPNAETINRNIEGISQVVKSTARKVVKNLPSRGTAKERKELNERIREYELPHALNDPSSERLHKNIKGISKSIKKHLPKAETKESHDAYMNSSTYQNKLIAEQKAKDELEEKKKITPPPVGQGPVGQGPVVLPTPSPAVHEPTPPPPVRPPRVTTQDGTIQTPVISNEVAIYEPPTAPVVPPPTDNSKAVVPYTPPTVKSVQESVPTVLVPDNIQPDIIMKYLKKQSNLRRGKYNPHILNNKSIVDQARVAADASFSILRK